MTKREQRRLGFPPLVAAADGLLTRRWLVTFGANITGRADLGRIVRKRALRLGLEILVAQGYPDLARLPRDLRVRVRMLSPRVLRVSVGRRGTSPNWDMAADSCVMEALEQLCSRIVRFQRLPRALWKLWPLPAAVPGSSR